MKNLKVKIVLGFRKEQEHTIDANEAHKAYYLFLNPEKRGIFKNGLAVLGQDIRSIQPDYHATMGWNPSHILDDYDWNEIRDSEIDKELHRVLIEAKEDARMTSLSGNDSHLLQDAK